MNAIFKMLLYLALIIVLVGIAYANADQEVDVTYFFGRTLLDVPVFLVMLSAMFVGVLMSGVVALVEHLKHSRRERELQRRIASLETEVKELRNLPIDGGLGGPTTMGDSRLAGPQEIDDGGLGDAPAAPDAGRFEE